MKALIEVNADVRHLYAAMTLCAVFDGFYKEPENVMQDDLAADIVPALLCLLIILEGSPEGYGHNTDIEFWAMQSSKEEAHGLITSLRRIADRIEAARGRITK